MRLDKFIGNSSDWSRTQIQRAIKRGEVTVNGELARLARQTVATGDRVTLQGKPIAPPAPRYLMLYKPEGVLCARTDSSQPCVLDLLDLDHKSGLQVVGRLDKDTTGLLLLTDDGQWNHRITSPNHHCPKIYRVTTTEPIAPDAAEKLRAGVKLRSEKHPCLPAELQLLDSHSALITLHEGRYHQVKRLFAALGNHVHSLHRQAIGTIELDATLNPGDWRRLRPEEVASI